MLRYAGLINRGCAGGLGLRKHDRGVAAPWVDSDADTVASDADGNTIALTRVKEAFR